MTITRRHFVGGALMGLASVPVLGRRALAAASSGVSLRNAGMSSGILTGCAVDIQRLRDTPAYTTLIAAQLDMVGAENAMKFGPMRPTPDTFFFTDADYLVDFAQKNGMKIRGHNFIWHQQLPDWFGNYVTTANAQAVLVKHIETVGGRYAGRIHSWDVVNEAIETNDGLPGGLRNSVWQQRLPGYIDIAFTTARRVDPRALLIYNDYGLEGEDGGSNAKRIAVLNLVQGMKQRGVPIDGVGIQSHIAAGGQYGAGLTNFIQQIGKMGLKVLITELDVSDRNLPAAIDQRDQAVAKTYGDYLTLTLANPNVIAVVTWGITDKYTWLNPFAARADKLPQRCLPFDENYQAKPAFFSEMQAIARAPFRR
jgi:endo-1,4-beta-xylanase